LTSSRWSRSGIFLFDILQNNQVDYTRFFRRLCDFKSGAGEKNGLLQGMFLDPASFDEWAASYQKRLTEENAMTQRAPSE
jgi:uncharacterized protein YdiU (UPF0061 family)